MEKIEYPSSSDTMDMIIQSFSKYPNFPTDYCNVASKQLLTALCEQGKNVKIQHSYKEAGDGHTFVVEIQNDGKEVILDPTYAQYDPQYTT